jgi:hypothetical protein
MSSDAAELSALSSAIDDLVHRVTVIAGRHDGTPRDDLVATLYDAERLLVQAARSLTKAVRALGR